MESRSRFDYRDPRLHFYSSSRPTWGNMKHSKSAPHMNRRQKLKLLKEKNISPKPTRSTEKTGKLPHIVTKVKGEPLPFAKANKIRSPKNVGRLIMTPPGLGYRPPFHVQTAGTPSKYGIPSTSFYYETPKKNRPATVSGRARWSVPTKTNADRRRYEDDELRDFWCRRERVSTASPNRRKTPIRSPTRKTPLLSPTSLYSDHRRPQTSSPIKGKKNMLQTRFGIETTTFNFGRSPLPCERRRLIRPD